ncbi:hypothetical protein LTR85_011191 [Meristemomyces frigidus]|nr:hypothetical protein LTR85_011191 [Meristemomyces frigidus]
MSNLDTLMLEPAPLLHVVRSTPACEASDPRDMIYSILGLITAQEKEIIGSSYEIPFADVYARATFASLKSRFGFSVLSLVKLANGDLNTIPTWTVDFREPSQSFVYLAGMAGEDTFLSKDCKHLTIRGPVLGMVMAGVRLDLPHVYGTSDTDEGSETGDMDEASDTKPPMKTAGAGEKFVLNDPLLPQMRADIDVNNDALFHTARAALGAKKRSTDYSHSTNLGEVLVTVFEHWDTWMYERHQRPGARVESLHVGGPFHWGLYQKYAWRSTGVSALFRTRSGYTGYSPDTLRAGDSLVVPELHHDPYGSEQRQWALILRPRGEVWTFHGLAYVYRMDELIQSRLPEQREFVIC